jgi:hypothetical protein
MADIKNIDVFQTVTSVSFEVEPNTDIININKVTTSGYGGIPNLQEVTDEGSATTNPITANSFIKSGGTGANVLLDNGNTTPLTSIVGTTNLTTSQTSTNFTINSNTGTDASVPLGNGTLAGATLNDYTTVEKSKLAGIATGAEVNVNADWNATSGDAQILNKPTIPSISGLATVTYVDAQDALKVDKIVGKGLSTEDYTTTEKNKLAGIAIGAEVNVNADWNAVSGDAQILNKPTIPSIAGLATTTYVDNKDNSQQLQLNYLDRDNSIFDAFYLRTIADNGTVEASNQLLSSLAVLRNISYVNQGYTQQINADKFVKLGGAADEFLMADGSISYGGGGGGATNLTTTQTSTNFTINSNTGTDATVPLGNGTLAGATLNDFTSAEKTKLAGIATGATVGVPYTGAVSDVNLGEFGIQLGNLEFDNTPTNIPTTAGSMYYNDTDGTLDLKLKGGNVTLQIGQEQVVRVVNKTATNITLLEANYQAVRITGAQGQRMKVDLAQATTDVLSSETIGLVTETIANNQEGFVTTSGLVRGINTTGSLQSETWLDGDILYLSPTVAGQITKVKPQAPNHLIIIGYVIYAHITQGTIFVKVDNGYEISELHDIKITTPANNNVLAYTSATDIWENKTVATALGYTPANDTSVVHLTGNETIAGVKTFSSNIVIPATGSALILSTSSGGTVSGLTTTTYPDLTELALLKGVTSAIQTQLNGKVSTNTAITGATKTKITYDSKGLVTSGADATTADISDSSNKRYVTDADLTVSGNTSGTNTGDNATNTQYSGLATSKQDTLQSTVNIKSINGNSLLGSGDLTISASAASQSAYTILANNTNVTAVPTEKVFKNVAEQIYTPTPAWTGTTAPSGTTNHTYSWSQIGNMVTIRLNLSYTVNGTSVSSVSCVLPSDVPTPLLPSSLTTNLDTVSYGSGVLSTNKAVLASPVVTYGALRLKTLGTPNIFEIVIARASANFQYAYATIQYFV